MGIGRALHAAGIINGEWLTAKTAFGIEVRPKVSATATRFVLVGFCIGQRV